MIQPGSRLGPYEISGALGAGGMGEVYRARDTRLDRSVAIKVLPTDFAGHPEVRARFQREARTISQLNHPNICTLYDVGDDGGVDYLVMELLEGETLSDRLSKGPLPLADVLRVGSQVADALARAHRHGIVHRDLKPGNVMLTKSGAKLLDFGLAKIARGLEPVSPESQTQRASHSDPITEKGVVLGTFQYMAPEQLEGEEADSRTDIFALGVLLYEMVTGRRAFQGKTRTSLIAAIVGSEPQPISAIQPLSPRSLESIIVRCMAKDPDERWQSAADVHFQLRQLAEGQQESAATATPRGGWRSRAGWIAAAILALATGFLAWQLSRSAPLVPYNTSIAAPEGSDFWIGGPSSGGLTISPDSRYMTFTSAGSDAVGFLWVRDLNSGATRKLPGTEYAEYPFWSPDSRQIAFFKNGKLKTTPVEGGTTVDVCDVKEARGGSWSRDGVIVFNPYWRDVLYRVPATGGKPVAITKLDAARGETTHRWPMFLPDGKHFLYFGGSHTAAQTSGDNGIFVASLDGGAPRLVVRARSNMAYAAGHLLYMRDQQLVAHRFNERSLTLEGDAVPLVDGLRYESGFFRGIFAASDAALAYQTGGIDTPTQLSWFNRDGKKLSDLGTSGVHFDVRLAPQGDLAAVATGDPSDLWLLDIERGTRSRITTDAWQELSPVWSPDASSILYWSDRNVQAAIWQKNRTSGAETSFLKTPDAHDKPLDWSRDGRFVALSREPVSGASKSDIWILPIGSDAKAFAYAASPFNEYEARFSPDGETIAFVSNESGDDEVYLGSFPSPSERLQVSSGGGAAPRWRGDGKELFYVDASGMVMSVSILSTKPFKAGAPAPLFRAKIVSAPDPFYDVTKDGQRFVINHELREHEPPFSLLVNWTSALGRR